MHLFYFVSIAFHSCNAPFKTRGMKNFWPVWFFKSASAFTTQHESPWTRNGVILLKLKWKVTLQNFRSPAKKWNVDHKNVIHSKSKQLYFNVAWNECYLLISMISNESDLNAMLATFKWIWSQMLSQKCRPRPTMKVPPFGTPQICLQEYEMKEEHVFCSLKIW